MADDVNNHDASKPLSPPSCHWWLYRVVFDGAQPRVLFVVAVHMAGAIETALRQLGAEHRHRPGDQTYSDLNVAACDRSAPVNCISSSVLFDMRMRDAQLGSEVH